MKYFAWILSAVILIGIGWALHEYLPSVSISSVTSYFSSSENMNNEGGSENSGNNTEVCAQVITPARDPKTGDIKEFPTPCDVPQGWVVIVNDVPGL